jgi:hypothetical protein
MQLETMTLFGTAQLYEMQLSFTNFTTEELTFEIAEFFRSVWLTAQL